MTKVLVANVWGIHVPKCGRCAYDAEFRQNCGCDEPAQESVFRTSCSLCDGKDRECPDCNGDEAKDWFQCPNAILRADPEASSRSEYALRLYIEQERHHKYPAPGGLSDQSLSWLAFCAIVDGERALWEEAKRDGKK